MIPLTAKVSGNALDFWHFDHGHHRDALPRLAAAAVGLDVAVVVDGRFTIGPLVLPRERLREVFARHGGPEWIVDLLAKRASGPPSDPHSDAVSWLLVIDADGACDLHKLEPDPAVVRAHKRAAAGRFAGLG